MRSMRVLLGMCAGLLVGFAIMPEATSLPRMSATSGAPCTTCHFNSDGGGLRSEIGWGTSQMTGAIDHEQTGLSILSDRSTNRVLDWMAIGGDARVQVARLGQPRETLDEAGETVTVTPDRHVIPMQLQPYIAIMPHDDLTLHGSYAAGPGLSDGEWCSTVYAGQTCAQGHLSWDPSSSLPTIRAGLFRPSLGIRHDDHTILTHVDASMPRPTVIPPNYAEVGVEASYQPRHWLRLDAGAFRPDQLADAVGNPDISESATAAAYLARATYFPRFDFGPDKSFYGWVGASVYGDVDNRFRADQGFVGLGWLDKGALMFELAHLSFGSETERRAINAASILNVQFREWLIAEGRLEQATTRFSNSDETHRRRAVVAGLQFYPVPFVKLRPEYRITDTDAWVMGQYMMQLHLFY